MMVPKSKRLDVSKPSEPKKVPETTEETGNMPSPAPEAPVTEEKKAEETAETVEKAPETVEEPPKEVKNVKKEADEEPKGAVAGIFTPSGVPETDNSALEKDIKDILNVQKGKRAVPSLVSFFSARSGAYRHVIIDVTDSIIEDAWKRYKEVKAPFIDEEEFMGIVYKILNTDIPRMYRAVAPVSLKK